MLLNKFIIIVCDSVTEIIMHIRINGIAAAGIIERERVSEVDDFTPFGMITNT